MRRVLRRAAVSCVLMSADATEAMLEPGLMVLGYDGQVDLARSEERRVGKEC